MEQRRIEKTLSHLQHDSFQYTLPNNVRKGRLIRVVSNAIVVRFNARTTTPIRSRRVSQYVFILY